MIIALLLTAAGFIIIFVEGDGYVSDVRILYDHYYVHRSHAISSHAGVTHMNCTATDGYCVLSYIYVNYAYF